MHRPEVLEALLLDLEHARPDHVVVTGDLTNISLPEEFEAARGWLERLGAPEHVTAVPGNHDAYVALPEARSWGLWSEYLASDAPGRALLADVCEPQEEAAIGFPSVRLATDVALVGLCSAWPTSALHASGTLGSEQLGRLEAVLAALGDLGRARVVLIHHPPSVGVVHRRRALLDADELGALLRRTGAELVLHGHLHRTLIGSLPGPQRPIPVVGVRSASHADTSSERCARYHTYEIEGLDGPAPRITLHEREYDAASHSFLDAGPQEGRLLTAC